MDGLNLAEHEIKAPKGTASLFYKDYSHRKNTISFFIDLHLYCKQLGKELDFFDYYFDKLGDNRKGKNLRAKNKIDISKDGKKYIIPDGIFKIVEDLNGAWKQSLYLFEMYNGRDTQRVVNQLYKHAEAMVNMEASKKYEMGNKAYRILSVFEFDGIKNATIERLSNHPKFTGVTKFFLFKNLEQITPENIAYDWLQFDGELVSFI